MNVLAEFRRVTTFIFDVDGVLTDGTAVLLQDGTESRRVNAKDALGLRMAMRNGFGVIALADMNSPPVMGHLHKIGLNRVYDGVKDKKQLVAGLAEREGLRWEDILYMADDLPDISLLKTVGLPCCPADAVPEILELSKYISPLGGGRGCVRDVIEKVLRVQDKWVFHDDVAF